jgi:hypothetical protein
MFAKGVALSSGCGALRKKRLADASLSEEIYEEL